MATFPYTGYLDGTPYATIPAGTTTVNVSSSAALTTALSNAAAGQRIVLANATYSGAFTLSGKNGTSSAGITIEAATTGGAVFASGSTISVSNCAYVTLKGLSFPYELASGNLVQFRGSSNRCRVTRCLFGPTAIGTSGTNKTPFIYMGDDTQHIRIDHNEFRNKANPGNTILGDGNFTTFQAVRWPRIDHNIFRSIKPEVDNEKEPIRIGVSTMSKTNSWAAIERNFFLDCICEPEIVSAKAGGIRITGNTVLRSIGGLVYRHGVNGVMADNYIVDRAQTFGTTIGSGGFRFYDAGHEVSYNYVDGVYGGNFQGPLILDSGDAEGSSTSLDAHWRVVNAQVLNNVLVGNPEGIRVGHNYSLAPTGCTISGNVVAQAATGTAVTELIAPVNTTKTNNTYASTPSAAGLAQDSLAIWRKTGVGPRLTYLQQGDVGITGDPNDTDGTGTLVSGGGGGTTPPPVVDDGTAATKFGWGSPLALSDEFEYTGSPNVAKWSVYNGPGHDGNGTRSPAQVSVSGGKMVLSGTSGTPTTAGLEHKLGQQYGRWEVRMRAAQTGVGGTGQTLGVGGIATPSGAILATSDSTSALTITTSGTASNPRVYDGQGRTIGRVTFDGCQYVVVQNYNIRSGNQYGVVFDGGSNNTLQNCDIANVRVSGDGDLNAITVWGGNANKIRYNTAINYVSGDPGGSHTDCIQTWVSSSHPNAATNYEIVGNKFIGPANPSRDNAIPSIHQIIMVEGAGRGGNSGGSGNPTGWFIAENEFGDSWNQSIKLDGGINFTITRNKFVGSSDKVFDLPLATGVKIYADNQFGSGYGSVGGTITAGAGPATPGGSGGSSGTNSYHPVLIVWPDSERWPEDGEYDFVELSTPGQQSLTAFMHYPHNATAAVQQIQFTKAGVDTSVFHNYAFEWTPTGLVGYVDGVQWFAAAGGASSIRRDIQTMPSGHLTVQLDAFASSSMIPATMELEWSRVYTLTPSGPTTGPQTVTAAGVASAERFGTALVTGASPAPQPGSTATILGGPRTVLGLAALGFTPPAGGGTDPLPGSQTVTGAGGIASLRALGRPVVSVPDGPPVVAAVGIASAANFGRPRFSGGAPPKPAPGGVLVPSLFAVGADGTTLTPLPAWTKISLSPVRNSPGALSVEYPTGAPGFNLLHDQVSAFPLRALEIRVWLGGSQEGALGGWLLQKSGDDLTPGSSWTFTGHFHAWILSKALVFPQAISDANKNGSLRFAGANAGLILSTVMDQAQARGALPLVTRDFTNTHDSAGQPWAQSVSSLAFSPKTTVAQVADKLVELGMCEYDVTAARVWRAFNPDSGGTDRTTGSAPLTFAHAQNLSQHARRESSRDAGTAVLVAGAEGFYATASSPTAQSELGWRAEVAGDAGQVASQVGVQAIAATLLETARAGVAEYSSAVEFAPGNPLPLLDYGVGDWAYTWAGSKRRRLRIAQIVLEFSNDAPPSGKVALNDIITDRISALYRRLNSISTGDAVVGTSTPTTGGVGEDNIPPAAPTGVTVSSTIAYQVPGEAVTRAVVDVGWAAVTTNAYADTVVAGKVQAAGYIADRMRSGQAIAEDWTWAGAPAVVGLYNDVLLQEWRSDPTNPGDSREPTDTLTIAATLAWLDAYPTTHQGGGTITDDVEKYRVQYRYLGTQPIGNATEVPGPDWDPTTPRDPNAVTESAGWFEPTESPTNLTRLTFGEVIGGRSIGVRVAAVDRTGNQSAWSAIVATTSAVDDQPPPVPSKPIVSAWFETMNVTWDGKGAAGEDLFAAASDLASGGRIEVHVALGIDFTPDRPPAGDGKLVDLSKSTTYKTDFQWAGTTNITDLVRGSTYFVRFVAVDRNGNASEPSETSDGVLSEQLVNIQIGPNAIARAQIIDGEIVNAKIADLAVNDAKISNLSVGKLTAGTMLANVVIGGMFQTPVSNGNQIQLDAAGLRMYRNNTVIGRWQVFDGSMMMTGQFQSNITGQRVVINPGGSNPDTIRLYPSFSETFSSITAFDFNGGQTAGIQIVGSGTDATSNRGQLVIRDQYASLVHGRTDLTYWGSEIWVEQNFTRNKSATVDLVVDERLTPIGGERRVAMIHYDTAGRPINATGLYYKKTAFEGGEPFLYGNGRDVGIIWAPGVLRIRNNPNGDWRGIEAATFTAMSGRKFKRNIRDIEIDPMATLRTVKPQQYRWHSDPDDAPEKIGLIAEELPHPIRKTIVSHPTDRTDRSQRPMVSEAYDLGSALATLWEIARRIDERLTAVEAAGPPNTPPKGPHA